MNKQKTIEEAKNNAWDNYEHVEGNLYSTSFKNGFEIGAKWHQEQDKNKYSEEDMIKFAFDTYHYISKLMGVPFNQISDNKLHAMYNFEQFKKK
jgi:hypothetical protein